MQTKCPWLAGPDSLLAYKEWVPLLLREDQSGEVNQLDAA